MGVAVALKPHFVVIWLALELGRYFEEHDWRRPEAIAAGCVLGGSWVLLPILHPEFLAQLRDYAHLYANFRRLPVGAMLRVESLTLIVVLVAWLASRRDAGLAKPVRESLLLIGATLCVAVVQGKGFTYHLYPTHALAALVLLVLMTSWEPAGPARWQQRLILLLVGASLALYTAWAGSLHRWSETPGQARYRPAVELVRESGVKAGSILVLSPHMLDAFPLVNLTGFEWASRYNSLWPLLSLYSAAEPVGGAVRFHSLSEMSSGELRFFQSVTTDLLRYAPDLLLVAVDRDPFLGGTFDYLGYLGQDSAAARLLEQYEPVARGERLELYVRRGASAPGDSASGAHRDRVDNPGDRGGVLVDGVPLARQLQGG
jgi:hypothetical protein